VAARRRGAGHSAGQPGHTAGQQGEPHGGHEEVDHRTVATLRKELSGLVGAWARRSGQPHGVVHAELRRRAGGPEVARADAAQIRARIELLRGWFAGRS